MKNSFIPCVVILALALWGCVSAERMAEYSAWQKSDDGVASVSLAEFESKYQNGWRERAATKMTQRFEFEEWKTSDDAIESASIEEFVDKYKSGWRGRAEAKKKNVWRVKPRRRLNVNVWRKSKQRRNEPVLPKRRQSERRKCDLPNGLIFSIKRSNSVLCASRCAIKQVAVM